MIKVLEAVLIWSIRMVLLLIASYCVSFGWHQARQVVLVNSNAEILTKIQEEK